jgi:hypothetical protein
MYPLGLSTPQNRRIPATTVMITVTSHEYGLNRWSSVDRRRRTTAGRTRTPGDDSASPGESAVVSSVSAVAAVVTPRS